MNQLSYHGNAAECHNQRFFVEAFPNFLLEERLGSPGILIYHGPDSWDASFYPSTPRRISVKTRLTWDFCCRFFRVICVLATGPAGRTPLIPVFVVFLQKTQGMPIELEILEISSSNFLSTPLLSWKWKRRRFVEVSPVLPCVDGGDWIRYVFFVRKLIRKKHQRPVS